MDISKTHIPSQSVVYITNIENAVWEIMRFGGYDKKMSVGEMQRTVKKDLEEGNLISTNFYEYRATAKKVAA